MLKVNPYLYQAVGAPLPVGSISFNTVPEGREVAYVDMADSRHQKHLSFVKDKIDSLEKELKKYKDIYKEILKEKQPVVVIK